VIVVRGLAGSGKTALLRALAAAGEQVLDLEGLARHRGSAFGHLGAGAAQPSHREFQRQVRAARTAADPARPLWVEDEGPFIGSVGVPPELQEEILTAPAVELRSPWEQRVGRLLAEYGGSPPDALCAAIRRTRLEPTVAARAIAAVQAGRTDVAIELVLPAFDSAYRHRMTRASGTLLAVLVHDGQLRSRFGSSWQPARSRRRRIEYSEDLGMAVVRSLAAIGVVVELCDQRPGPGSACARPK
jgi:tRNA 2-selenouridine synthase